jgi:hypothetical protein
MPRLEHSINHCEQFVKESIEFAHQIEEHNDYINRNYRHIVDMLI